MRQAKAPLNRRFHLPARPSVVLIPMAARAHARQPRPSELSRLPGLLLRGASLLLLAASLATATACSVPVFRYALERWPADDYLVVVFHGGELTPAQTGCVRDLGRTGLAGGMLANVSLHVVDLTGGSGSPFLRWWQQIASGTKPPAMVLLPPRGLGLPTPAWHGPLTTNNVKQLLDSPLRREIARRLLQGDSAVWVLLESGDPKLDLPAAQMLAARLQHLEANLKLPELNPADVVGGAVAASEEILKVAFSLLRVSRQDPAEGVLMGMLLNTEEDLKTVREPIAFPIFGRGRVLYALVGPGINPEMIDEASQFLTGACSCLAKEQNPGKDLLLAVDWAGLVEPLIKNDAEPPPLAGLTAFAADRATANAGPAPPNGIRPTANPTAEERHPTRSLVSGLLAAGAGAGGLLVAATWWLLRRRG